MPPGLTTTTEQHCDVLVLGAGLAGLQAAWAARQTALKNGTPLRVIIATPTARPSGSSFANRNNALGMQAPNTHQAAAFISEAMSLASPGAIDLPLVQALATDAPSCLSVLLDLNLPLRRDAEGELLWYPGCFSTEPRAVIFEDLANAHRAFLDRALAYGAELLAGVEAVHLHVRGGRVCGATLRTIRGGSLHPMRANTVIAALGGPAPLYAHRTCGPGSGLSYGLLAQAGAKLINAPYLQFFWVHPHTLEFTNPASLAWPGCAPELAPKLIQARARHCPTAYGLPDAELDQRLMAQAGPNGVVLARLPQGETIPLVLAAHAGNGGARIDTQGRTTIPGLFACGECASGMHGANRLGGGMVLSALVFGARAGAAAATESASLHLRNVSELPHLRLAQPSGHAEATFLRQLRHDMQRCALPFQTPFAHKREGLRKRLIARLANTAEQATTSARVKLLSLSALAVLGALPQ